MGVKATLREKFPWIYLSVGRFYYAIRRRLETICYKGKDVYCPCCDKYFRAFPRCTENDGRLTKWQGEMENIYCPNCDSGVRHRIICYQLEQNSWLEGFEKQNILHFAPEKSFDLWFKRKKYNV